MKTKGLWPFSKTWYSICSKHQKYQKKCPLCNKGNWVNDVKHSISTFIYKNWPKLWRRWAGIK